MIEQQIAAAQVKQALQLGMTLVQAGRFQQALNTCMRALSLAPKHPGLALLTGISQNGLGRPEAALAWFDITLQANPKHPDAHYNRGMALERLGQLDEAVAAYRQVLGSTTHLPSLFNLANCLAKKGTPTAVDEARQILTDLVATHQQPVAHLGLGMLALRAGELEDACKHYGAMLEVQPGNPEAVSRLGETLIKLDRFDQAWPLLASSVAPDSAGIGAALQEALPARECEAGKSVLLWAEQGLGDALMLTSVLPDVLKQAGRVGLVCDSRLHPVLAQSFGEALVLYPLSGPENLTEWDTHCPLYAAMSAYRKTRDDFTATASGYLTADGARAENIRADLGVDDDTQLIGVSWQSTSANTGKLRSVALNQLLAALTGPRCVFVNLQYGDVEEQLKSARASGFDIRELSDLDCGEDIEGLAALMGACDQVVTIDNNTVHLGGALGLRQVLLLPYFADWRWGDGAESVLYQDTEIARQTAPNDWRGALAQAAERLTGA